MARTLKGIDPKKAKPSRPKILIFGKPNTRKTSVALDFPSTYYIDCEGGANLPYYTDKLKKSGGLYLGPDMGANDFETVIEETITLATVKHDYRTLVIDSYSKLFNTHISRRYEKMEKAGVDMLTTSTFGKEKIPAIGKTRELLRWLDKLDMNVILVCHEKDVWQDQKLVGATFDGWEKLAHELHLNLHIFKQGNSSKARVVKTRLEGFPDNDCFDWTYEEFAARHGREVIESKSVPVILATDAQLAEFRDLLDVVRLPEKVAEKWDECGDVSQLTTDEIQKRIDWLKAQFNKKGAA